MSKMSDFTARIDEKITGLPNTTDLSTDQKEANVDQAVRVYSRNKPYIKLDEKSGSGVYTYDLPSDWVYGFSIFTQIEYPAGQSQDPNDDVIPPEEWEVYFIATNSAKLRFLMTSPTSGYTIRRRYTIPHSVGAAVDSSTVYANDFDAVAALAAGLCCFDLSRRYSQDNSSYISADSVNRQTKSEKYASTGKGLVMEYKNHMGLGEETTVPGSSTKDLDTQYSWGQDFLTHPADQR